MPSAFSLESSATWRPARPWVWAQVLALLGVALCSAGKAEALELRASVDQDQLTLNDQLQLTVTVEGAAGSIDQPQLPPLDDWTVYSAGRSQNISIINGQFSSSLSFTYALVPHTTGSKTLGPITLRHDGQTHQTDPIQVEVLPAHSPPVRGGGPAAPGAPSPRAAGKELFIKTYVDNLRPYVNQQITLTFVFYQAVDLFENPQYSPPSTTGFWAEDLLPPQRTYRQVIDGVEYRVTEVRTALFPTTSGDLTIGPARLVASVEQVMDFFRRSPFQMFQDPFSMLRQGEPVELTSEPITVDVRPLPEEGRPDGFKGDVGRYAIDAHTDRAAVTVGEPVTLRIRIAGEGNVKTITLPEIPAMPGARVYDSGSAEQVSKTGALVQGERVFETVIVPLEAGLLEIPAVRYSYFDPTEARYQTVTTAPIQLTVAPGAAETALPPVAPTAALPSTQAPPAALPPDIREIRTGALRPVIAGLRAQERWWCVVVHAALPIAYVGLVWAMRRRRRLKADVGYARRMQARRQARARLAEARRHLREGKSDAVAVNIHRALAGYLGDRLNLPQAGLTTDEVRGILAHRTLQEGMAERVTRCLSACDQVRFAPEGEPRALQSMVDEAQALVAALERAL